MNLGISCVPKGVEASTPRGNHSRDTEHHKSQDSDGENGEDSRHEECLNLFPWGLRSNKLDKGNQLKETKNS